MHLYTNIKQTYKHTFEKTVLARCNLSADNISWYRCIMYTICAQGTRVTYTQLHFIYTVCFSHVNSLPCAGQQFIFSWMLLDWTSWITYCTSPWEQEVVICLFIFLIIWRARIAFYCQKAENFHCKREKRFTTSICYDTQTLPRILPSRPRFCYEQ